MPDLVQHLGQRRMMELAPKRPLMMKAPTEQEL
jgi:hypothetical protein